MDIYEQFAELVRKQFREDMEAFLAGKVKEYPPQLTETQRKMQEAAAKAKHIAEIIFLEELCLIANPEQVKALTDSQTTR